MLLYSTQHEDKNIAVLGPIHHVDVATSFLAIARFFSTSSTCGR